MAAATGQNRFGRDEIGMFGLESLLELGIVEVEDAERADRPGDDREAREAVDGKPASEISGTCPRVLVRRPLDGSHLRTRRISSTRQGNHAIAEGEVALA